MWGTEPVGLRDFQGMKNLKKIGFFNVGAKPSSLVWNVPCPRFEPSGSAVKQESV